MSFHADVEGLEASAKDPGIEGGEGGAGTAAEEVDFLYQFLFSEDGAAEDAALAVEPFGSGVNDEVSAEIDRKLADGCRETVVDDEEQVVLAREGGGGFEIDNVQSRIGGSFQVDHFGFRPDGGFPVLWIGGVDIAVFDAVFGEVFGNDGMGAAEDSVAGQKVVALFEETEEGGDDGAHAGGGGKAGFGAFEGAETVGKFFHGRIAEAGIHEGVLLIGKDGTHVFGIVIAEAAGQVKRGGMFLIGGLVGADADGFGDAVCGHGWYFFGDEW